MRGRLTRSPTGVEPCSDANSASATCLQSPPRRPSQHESASSCVAMAPGRSHMIVYHGSGGFRLTGNLAHMAVQPAYCVHQAYSPRGPQAPTDSGRPFRGIDRVAYGLCCETCVLLTMNAELLKKYWGHVLAEGAQGCSDYQSVAGVGAPSGDHFRPIGAQTRLRRQFRGSETSTDLGPCLCARLRCLLSSLTDGVGEGLARSRPTTTAHIYSVPSSVDAPLGVQGCPIETDPLFNPRWSSRTTPPLPPPSPSLTL